MKGFFLREQLKSVTFQLSVIVVCRNAFTVISNLAVYAVAWLLFSRDHDLSHEDDDVNPADATKFMVICSLLCISILLQRVYRGGRRV